MCQTPMRIGSGKVAIGKSEELTVFVLTKVVICVNLSGICPARIPQCKKHFTMPELAAGQNIWIKGARSRNFRQLQHRPIGHRIN